MSALTATKRHDTPTLRKLTLKRETLRRLTPAALRSAVGGAKNWSAGCLSDTCGLSMITCTTCP